jgi:hypothetical protein
VFRPCPNPRRSAQTIAGEPALFTTMSTCRTLPGFFGDGLHRHGVATSTAWAQAFRPTLEFRSRPCPNSPQCVRRRRHPRLQPQLQRDGAPMPGPRR